MVGLGLCMFFCAKLVMSSFGECVIYTSPHNNTAEDASEFQWILAGCEHRVVEIGKSIRWQLLCCGDGGRRVTALEYDSSAKS